MAFLKVSFFSLYGLSVCSLQQNRIQDKPHSAMSIKPLLVDAPLANKGHMAKP
jgi:hypothetical protein